MLALAWVAVAATWALLRLGLYHAFTLPAFGLGFGLLLALVAVSSWALVEEPRLAPGGAALLGRMLLGGVLLASGEACLYPFVQGKEALAPLGMGLLFLGAGLFWPSRPQGGSRIARGGALLLLALGAYTWLTKRETSWELFVGPVSPTRQWAMVLFWLCLAGAFFGLAWQAARPAPDPGREAALPLRQEAAWLALVLAVAALFRFYRPGGIPQGWWYDEVNLARVIQDQVLLGGKVPLYVAEQVENPGAWLWVGAVFFKVFGVQLTALRLASGLLGLLALLPFWALARLWVGARWALAATFIFGVMRWVLIPQRIAFMSGFALFWMLAAFWALWSAQLRSPQVRSAMGWGRWLLAGLLIGANLHTYTPARFVPVILAVFLLLQWALDPAWRQDAWRKGLALAAGSLLVASPMLYYIGTHWGEYIFRSQQVSIFTDVKASGKGLLSELWISFSKHLLMFNFRGDFNARHNIHFFPHADFILACGLALALPWSLGRAWRDARARFMWLWLGVMLAAAVFTVPVEAPQGHRSILAAPVLPLALVFALRELAPRFAGAFMGAVWPRTARSLALALLASMAVINGQELLARWSRSEATFRSFSPRSSAVMRRVAAASPGTLVYTSELAKEYQFNGFEWGIFARFQLRQSGLQWSNMRPSQAVPPQSAGQPTRQVLAIWGESDVELSQAFSRQFPDLDVERAPQPYPGQGEPAFLYLAAVVPYERLPHAKAGEPAPLFYRVD